MAVSIVSSAARFVDLDVERVRIVDLFVIR
jgi:hypothetical protein